MTNTALRAENSNSRTITFKSREHEKFYEEYLKKCRYQDVYHRALVYCLGIDRDTRENVNKIYNFKTGCVKTECLQEGWQTSGSLRIVRMAFNLAGFCVGVGGSVISGRLLGAKKRQKASEVFAQTMVTAVVIGVILSLAVFVLFTPIFGFLRADGELSGYFTDYYRIMLFTYPLMVLGTILGMFIRVNGKPQLWSVLDLDRESHRL